MTKIKVSFLLQQVPGFAVGFEEAAGALGFSVGVEADGFARTDGFDGDDVPSIARRYKRGDEINFVAGVGDVSAIGVAADDDGESAEVSATVGGETGLDLNAEKAALVLDEEVVGMAFSVGLGDAEAEAGGFVGEGELGEFSATLVVELVLVHASAARHWFGPIWFCVNYEQEKRRGVIRACVGCDFSL